MKRIRENKRIFSKSYDDLKVIEEDAAEESAADILGNPLEKTREIGCEVGDSLLGFNVK